MQPNFFQLGFFYYRQYQSAIACPTQGFGKNSSNNASVTPADIWLWIQQAKQLGWIANRSGKSLTLKVMDDCLQIIN